MERYEKFVGIDPGKSGALAVIGSITHIVPFDKETYVNTLFAWKNDISLVVLEHVGPMPKQGVTSTFKFGENFGWLQGVLDAFGIPYELVRPQKWKREFSCTSDKNTSIEVAKRLFPHASLLRTPKCSKPDDGIAEALLMAEYARRIKQSVLGN